MEMNIKKRSTRLALATAFAGTMLGLSGVAHAGTCNTVVAVGSYGFEADGWSEGSPLAAVGQIDLDGTGDASLVGYFTRGGYTQAVQYYGSYNVNADCSATLTLHSGSDETDILFRAQFVRAGLEFKFLIEDTYNDDTTVVGSANRVFWK